MYVDPVVEEIRQNGEKIADQCGGDLHRMAEYFRRRQREVVDKVAPTPQSSETASVKPEKPAR